MNYLLTLSLLTLVSCSGITTKHRVSVDQLDKLEIRQKPNTKVDKYYRCVVELNREGIKQILIKELCNATYGTIE